MICYGAIAVQWQYCLMTFSPARLTSVVTFYHALNYISITFQFQYYTDNYRYGNKHFPHKKHHSIPVFRRMAQILPCNEPWQSWSTVQTMLFVRPTRGHGRPYNVKLTTFDMFCSIHDTRIHDTCTHDTCIHDTCIHDTCIHDTCISATEVIT